MWLQGGRLLFSAFCGNVKARPAVPLPGAVLFNSEWNQVIQLRSTYFWWWLCHRLSKDPVWVRLSKCSLKGTAKEAKSKIKCSSCEETVVSIITQQQHSQQNVPKVGVSSPLTITHPAPNTRRAEYCYQCSRMGSKHNNEDLVSLT